MLQVLVFILSCVINFIKMLFTIDLGFTNLGTLMCIIYILLPVMLVIVNFLKYQVMDEINERYDESRPRETWTSSDKQFIKLGNGHTFSTSHNRTRSRRYKL